MRYLLSAASRPILRKLARERALCAFDFDGTLSPIVTHPDCAVMRPRTRSLLSRLASLYPCAVLSGRARADLLNKLTGVKVARAIGNHGAETEIFTRKSRRRVKRWKAALAADLGDLPGFWVEDKGLSLALHFRQAPNKAETRERLLAASGKLKRVHIFGGKQVINLVPDDSPDKGDALAIERERLGCNWTLYVGDDDNDEAAFALSGNVVPVRIGKKKNSNARFYLRTQGEIDKLLQLLVAEAARRSAQ